MGGGGGGPRSIGDIKSLVERAKKELREGEEQGRRNVLCTAFRLVKVEPTKIRNVLLGGISTGSGYLR